MRQGTVEARHVEARHCCSEALLMRGTVAARHSETEALVRRDTVEASDC